MAGLAEVLLHSPRALQQLNLQANTAADTPAAKDVFNLFDKETIITCLCCTSVMHGELG